VGGNHRRGITLSPEVVIRPRKRKGPKGLRPSGQGVVCLSAWWTIVVAITVFLPDLPITTVDV
jgi:hypothetical protein